jgi:hypothetical protein
MVPSDEDGYELPVGSSDTLVLGMGRRFGDDVYVHTGNTDLDVVVAPHGCGGGGAALRAGKPDTDVVAAPRG